MADAPKGGNPMHDLYWFLGILLALFFIWYATGGPERYRSGEASRTFQATTSLRSAQELEAARETSRARGTASPVEGRVEIRSSNAKSTDPNEEYLVLEAPSNSETELDLTGWQLRSAVTGNAAFIGYSTRLPQTGIVNAAKPLALPPGGRVIVVTGTSPIGTSFRINKCIGYFEEFQDFTPSLSRSCPQPEAEFRRYADVPTTSVNSESDAYDLCLAFVEGLSQCTMYHPRLRDEGPELHSSCVRFLETYLNYPGCVAAHQHDADFYQNEWRVYLGERRELWRDRRETILLLDAQGRTVDTYTY